MSGSPVDDLDEVVHQRYRLGILAYLSGVGRADFTAVRAAVGLTDGNLNRHLAKLTEAGLVAVHKGGRPAGGGRTQVELTAAGRSALGTHVAALRRLLDHVDPPGGRR